VVAAACSKSITFWKCSEIANAEIVSGACEQSQRGSWRCWLRRSEMFIATVG